MLLKGTNLAALRGGRELFAIETLEIREGDRIGLVGVNGAGKSTLLHGLYGDVPLTAGQVLRRAPMAMIAQDAATSSEPSPLWAKRLGLGATVQSGGERTRRAIAAALSENAPLLLADEPTTNLDINGTLLVEKLLTRYDGALVLVSHDRRLLDTVCTTIWALEQGQLRIYPGNYSAYLAQSEREREQALAEYLAYQAEKKRLEAAARAIQTQARKMVNTSRLVAKGHSTAEIRGARPFHEAAASRKAKQAKATLRRIDHLEVKEKPQPPAEITMTLGAARSITARKVFTVKDLTVRYGDKTVLDHVSFSMPTGSRTVIMGPNGAGKSTLLKALVHGDPAVSTANGLRIGYFAQGHEQLDHSSTALANARAHSDLPEHVVRTILARLASRPRWLLPNYWPQTAICSSWMNRPIIWTALPPKVWNSCFWNGTAHCWWSPTTASWPTSWPLACFWSRAAPSPPLTAIGALTSPAKRRLTAKTQLWMR